MQCGRQARFEVNTVELEQHYACERHVQQVTVHRGGGKIRQAPEDGLLCSWEMLSVGDMLRIILRDKGWTQKKLSEISGVPQQSISELCRGRKRLVPMTAVKLAAALGLCPLAMLGTQVDYALWQWEQDNPGAADEVRARLSQESD